MKYSYVDEEKKWNLIQLTVVIAILTILFVMISGRGCINVSPGDGKKIGQVVKLSKQGLSRKTWEGQLIRGGMNGGSGSFGTVPFDFTVEGEELVKKVEGYMRDQTEVVITYRIEGIYSPYRSESHGRFLVSIEPIQQEKTNK